MNGRIFLAPAGSEVIGFSADGVPVAADQRGAGEMIEITAITRFGFTNAPGEDP